MNASILSPLTGANPPVREPESAASVGNKVLLLGLGNDILTDDAVGLKIVRQVRDCLAGCEIVDVCETSEMGLSLLDYIVGYRDLVLVDAVRTGKAPPGFLHEIEGDDLKALPTLSPHFLGVGEMLALGRELRMAVPKRVKILAVEVQDPFTMGTQMTPALQGAMPALIERVLAVLRRWMAQGGLEAAAETACRKS